MIFQAILDGKKKFELRLDDFDCTEGDMLILKEWDSEGKKYTGREMVKEVTFVVKTKDVEFWTKNEVERFGYQVIGFS